MKTRPEQRRREESDPLPRLARHLGGSSSRLPEIQLMSGKLLAAIRLFVNSSKSEKCSWTRPCNIDVIVLEQAALSLIKGPS